MMLPGIFVVGTDTGVGKTKTTCWLARILADLGWKVGVCKPAVSGAVWQKGRWVWDDVEALKESCRLDVPDDWIAPFRFHSPLAPPAASKQDQMLYLEGKIPQTPILPSIDDYLDSLNRWQGRCDFLLVEGVGGLLCPLTPTETVAELAQRWGRPILIVARLGLGTLNHTLMTVECAERRGLDVAGILLNQTEFCDLGLAERTNPVELKQRLRTPVLGPTPYHTCDDIPLEMTSINWEAIVQSRQAR